MKKNIFIIAMCTIFSVQSQESVIIIAEKQLTDLAIIFDDIDNNGDNEVISLSKEIEGLLTLSFSNIATGWIETQIFELDQKNMRGLISIDIFDDGKKSIAFVHSDSLSVIHQGNNREFRKIDSYYCGKSTDGIAKGDFNKDGFQDIVCSNWNSTYLRIFYGSPLGFSSTNILDIPTVNAGYNQIKVYDLDRNGHDDIVFLAGQGEKSGVYCYLNQGDSISKTPVYFSMDLPNHHLNPTNIVFGKFFGFGQGLVVNESWGGNTMMIIYDVLDKKLKSIDVPSWGSFSGSGMCHDIDKDGSDELIQIGSNGVSIYDIKREKHIILDKSICSDQISNQLLAIGDMDGDGESDIVQANDNGKITIYKTNTSTALIQKK